MQGTLARRRSRRCVVLGVGSRSCGCGGRRDAARRRGPRRRRRRGARAADEPRRRAMQASGRRQHGAALGGPPRRPRRGRRAAARRRARQRRQPTSASRRLYLACTNHSALMVSRLLEAGRRSEPGAAGRRDAAHELRPHRRPRAAVRALLARGARVEARESAHQQTALDVGRGRTASRRRGGAAGGQGRRSRAVRASTRRS